MKQFSIGQLTAAATVHVESRAAAAVLADQTDNIGAASSISAAGSAK